MAVTLQRGNPFVRRYIALERRDRHSHAGALAVIHKSVRVEIFRGIRVIPSLLEKEVSRKARKGAKKSDFLCSFAYLRETCSLELSNIHVY